MKWISVNDSLPHEGRYLVMTKCLTGIHIALAWNYEHPCCRVNIAYFIPYKKMWEYATNFPLASTEVTHWAELPNPPEFEGKNE